MTCASDHLRIRVVNYLQDRDFACATTNFLSKIRELQHQRYLYLPASRSTISSPDAADWLVSYHLAICPKKELCHRSHELDG